jgi:hypothetical protein
LYHFSNSGEYPNFGLVTLLSKPGFVGLEDCRDGCGEVVEIKLIRDRSFCFELRLEEGIRAFALWGKKARIFIDGTAFAYNKHPDKELLAKTCAPVFFDFS